MSQSTGHGVVKFSALGGHFYIDSETSYHSPPEDADVASDVMYQFLAELNEDHGWEITTHHIKDGIPICEVSWEPSDRIGHSHDYDFDLPDGLSMDWYDRSRLWSWD